MGNQLKDVKAKARALLGDPLQDWCDDAYIMPFVEIAWDEAIMNLKVDTSSPFITSLVEGLNYSSGTTLITTGYINASTEQQQSNPFRGLMNVLEVEWKQAGTPESWYQFAVEKNILPNYTPITSASLTPSGVAAGKMCYEWRAYNIYTTPLIFPADFRIRGEFDPSFPTKDTDELVLHPKIATALGFEVASLAGGERINATYIQNWANKAAMMYEAIANDLVKQGQGTTVRISKVAGRRRRAGYGQSYSV